MILYMFNNNMTWTVSKVTMNYESSSQAEQAQLYCTRDAGAPEHDVSIMHYGVVGIYFISPPCRF